MSADTSPTASASRLLGEESFKSHSIAHPTIRNLRDNWNDEILETTRRRDIRLVKVDQESRKSAGIVAEDEEFAPIRLTDQTIIREQSAYIGYITQAENTLHFQSISDSSLLTDPITKHFTDVTRYTGWEIPHLQNIDGFQTHGTNAMLIDQDLEQPGHLAIEYIPHDRLFYPLDTENIQDAPMIIVQRTVTRMDAKGMLKDDSGWNHVEVRKMFDTLHAKRDLKDVKDTDASTLVIWQVFFKEDGVVYEGTDWENGDTWLKAPKRKQIGRVILPEKEANEAIPVPETEYPIVFFQYRISEVPILAKSKGRVYLDEPLQDTLTSLQSSFVTSHKRSTDFYMTKGDNSPDSSAPAITDFKMVPNTYLNKNVKQFQLQPAPPELMNIIQSIRSQGMEEGGAAVNFSVANRKDSRKTAAEIGAAQDESAKLSGIQVVNYSLGYLQLYVLFWDVYRSRVLADLIPVVESLKTFFNPTVKYRYISAGHVEVIEKAKTLVDMQAAWPVVEGTPAADVFLADLLTLMFPKRAHLYIEALQQGNAEKSLIQDLWTLVNQLLKDPETGDPIEEMQNPQAIESYNALAQRVSGTLQVEGVKDAQITRASGPRAI